MVFGTLQPDGPEIEQAYQAACDVLVHLAGCDCPAHLPLPDGKATTCRATIGTPCRSRRGLVLDWFWPECKSAPADSRCWTVRRYLEPLFRRP